MNNHTFRAPRQVAVMSGGVTGCVAVSAEYLFTPLNQQVARVISRFWRLSREFWKQEPSICFRSLTGGRLWACRDLNGRTLRRSSSPYLPHTLRDRKSVV